jgi:hypothetical protein
MFTKIKKFFSSFASNTHDSLETFLLSKNVKTTSELEYWIRYYDQKKKPGFF